MFVDVLVAKAELLGHTANAETLDSLNEQPSTNLTRIVKRLVTFGVYQPRRLFAIVFHSGSVMEIACQEVSVVSID